MYTLLDSSQHFEFLDGEAKRLASQLVSLITPIEKDLRIAAGTDFAKLCADGSFFSLKDGHLAFKRGGSNLFFYNEGDLVGLEGAVHKIQGEISSEFGVVADRFSMADLFGPSAAPQVSQAALKYMSVHYQAMVELNSTLLKGEVALSPEIKHFEPGTVIIEQGDPADLVYTLVEGRADALVDGVKVGEIGPDQVFGMLAVVTGTPRTARVVAVSKCLAIAIQRERFIELIQQKPHTVLKLIEDMANTIVSLNTQVVGLSKPVY
ncbi:MAG: cyclic nucleotide-binding domain-containing protein [Deltaproteobacteria bacterium]|nr:cyclic nucleotide-binding domain-containing protein [Deltaproteobacteria bacterium]